MQCLECGVHRERLDNDHLIDCCGLTLHEYAIRHHLPLDLLLHADQVNRVIDAQAYPRVRSVPGEEARCVLEGLRWAGRLAMNGNLAELRGDIRQLDLLLWNLERLEGYGFRYCQDFEFDDGTNRVVARNLLRARIENLHFRDGYVGLPEPPPDFEAALATCVAHAAELQAGYLFIALPNAELARDVMIRLHRDWGIAMVLLDTADAAGEALLRAHTVEDSQRLLTRLERRLKQMPGVQQRFTAVTPEVTVVKELVFDSAHFITDHPAKCSNLHGGRYKLQVKVRGRIDPTTGCVIDYGYLKRVVNRRIIEKFDHHHLNFVASELAWRSSTELLSVYVWEQLIDYLPGLQELQLFETEQSWCHYSGPTLEEFQASGSDRTLQHFTQQPSRSLELRRRMCGKANLGLVEHVA